MNEVTLPHDLGSAFQVLHQHVSAYFSCAYATGLKVALENMLVIMYINLVTQKGAESNRDSGALYVINAFLSFNHLALYWHFFLTGYSVLYFRVS